VDVREISEHDLICSGFPCQSFSIAGKRRGFEDTRGTLFFEICRIAEFHRPKYLFLENVKGLLNHEEGRTFGTILNSLQDLGYGVEWQVLNSKDFGVPQNRERVFIIGHLGGFSGQQVFPVRGKEGIALKRIVEVTGQTPSGRSRQGDRLWSVNGASPTIMANLEHTIPKILSEETEMIRYLTPIECERLQGFPDGWTEGILDTQRYKLLGNAVTVNVIESIINNFKPKKENNKKETETKED